MEPIASPPADLPVPSGAGRVEAIYITPAAGEPMRRVERVRALAGRGLDGDRYALGTGHWSPIRRSGDSLTLIEAEAIEAVARETGLILDHGDVRRNVVVRGIRLDELLGREIQVGTIRGRVVRRCEPCSYLEELLGRPVLSPLVHRAGVRVDIVADGEIAVGDQVLPAAGRVSRAEG